MFQTKEEAYKQLLEKKYIQKTAKPLIWSFLYDINNCIAIYRNFYEEPKITFYIIYEYEEKIFIDIGYVYESIDTENSYNLYTFGYNYKVIKEIELKQKDIYKEILKTIKKYSDLLYCNQDKIKMLISDVKKQ